jgi:hypothetical protein
MDKVLTLSQESVNASHHLLQNQNGSPPILWTHQRDWLKYYIVQEVGAWLDTRRDFSRANEAVSLPEFNAHCSLWRSEGGTTGMKGKE